MKPFGLVKFKYAGENCLFTRQGTVSKSVYYSATVDPEHGLQETHGRNDLDFSDTSSLNSNKIHS